MKNTLKFLGVIALAAIIGISFTGCDNTRGGNSDDPFNAGGNLSFDSALRGTWVGNEENGTLVITANSISSPDPLTNAAYFALGINSMVLMSVEGVTYSLSASGGNMTATASFLGYSESEVMYTYTISGSTLKIFDPDGYDGPEIIFEGTKQ